MNQTSTTNAQTEQGRNLLESGEVDKAVALLEQVLAREPKNVQGLFLLGVGRFRQKRFGDSERLFRSALAADARHFRAQYYLGLALERQDRKAEAITCYRAALEAYPGFKEAADKLRALGVEARSMPEQKAPDKQASVRQAAGGPTEEPLAEGAEAYTGKVLIAGHRRMRSFSFLFLFMQAVVIVAMLIATGREPQLAILLLGAAFLLLVTLIAFGAVTRYTVYEKRIDFETGLLFREKRSVWVYKIDDVWLKRSPFNLLTGDATVQIHIADTAGSHGPHVTAFRITGLRGRGPDGNFCRGGARDMTQLWQEIRDAALVERRSMKRWWV